MKVGRSRLFRLLAVLSLACALFSGFFFIQAISSPEIVEKKILVGEYTQVGRLDYSANLKSNLIYGKEKITRNEVLYSALLNEMEAVYSYSISPSPEKLNGSYTITLVLTPVKGGWKKELGVQKGKFSSSSFDLSIPIDWNLILKIWKEIENETKYDFGDPNVNFIVDLSLNFSMFGSNVEERFLHSSNITYGKVILFSESDKVKKDAIYSKISSVNTMSVLGFPVEVRDARLIFGIPFLAFMCVLGVFGVVERKELAFYISNRKRKSFERKFRNRIVRAFEFPNYSKVFHISNLKDIAKLSYELEKPILRIENKFVVVDGDTVYIYDDNYDSINRKK